MIFAEVSIIIVNYNGKSYVDKCVDSILKSESPSVEVIVVDNGSVDESIMYLSNKYKNLLNIKFIELDKNYGPAYARNIGVSSSSGIYIGFLDNDTVVDKNWVIEAITKFKYNPQLAIIQCKLILASSRTRLDYVGEYLGQNGFLVQRNIAGEEDTGQYDQVVEILAAKSAGMFITKEAFIKIGGFDPDFFIYVEETDLGWRSWLAGYHVIYLPSSIVYHEFGTSSIILSNNQNNRNGKYHGCKNYILTLCKNLGVRSLVAILPIHVGLWLGLAWYSLIRRGDWKAFTWIHLAISWNFINIGRTLTKRRLVQNERKITDNDLFKIIMRKRPLSYFINKVTIVQKVGNAEGFIKSE
jgi:GT2 family glycosyltransferase